MPPRPEGRGRHDSVLRNLDPDLAAAWTQVDRDFHNAWLHLMVARLRPVFNRGTPLVGLRPAPVVHTARLDFADGTSVIAAGRRPSDLAHLAVVTLTHRPSIASYAMSRAEGEARRCGELWLEFVSPTGHSIWARVMGPDQAD